MHRLPDFHIRVFLEATIFSKIPLKRHSGEGRARSEALVLSINFRMLWMPNQVRHDELGTFYGTVKIDV
jgi:hypothetical protein